MTEQPGVPDRSQLRASDDDRERVAKILHSAMSAGRIDMAELEERLDLVYKAKTLHDLEPVTVDLPEAGARDATIRPPVRQSPDQPAPRDLVGGVPGSATSVAVMSGATRNGSWVVPAHHKSLAFWGGVEIDLRSARFAQQHTRITAVAFMGGIEIVVPDDITVNITGNGLMGAFELQDKSGAPPADPDAPVVTIDGFAFWGAVEVTRKPRQHPQVRGKTPPAVE